MLASSLHFLGVEAKSLIFLWRVFAEFTNTRRSYGIPEARHVCLMFCSLRVTAAQMSRKCPGYVPVKPDSGVWIAQATRLTCEA